MENSRKEKVIKILKRVGIGISIAFNFLFVLALVIGSSVNKKQNNNIQVACAESEVIEFKQDNKKLVSYNDERQEITLSANELNNYIFDNFNDVLVENSSTLDSKLSEDDFITYDGNEFVYTSNDKLGDYVFLNFELSELVNINFNDGYDDNFNGYVANTFKFFDEDTQVYTFNYEFVLHIENLSFYNQIKQAIELDIQANSQDINNGIFETLTESTVGFIGTLGNGIVAMTSIFYDSTNSQLTTIGLLSVIVVAVSLCYFLFRLIIGLIRMRG